MGASGGSGSSGSSGPSATAGRAGPADLAELGVVLRRAAAMVFVASLDDLMLDPADAHHLGRVLRLRDGEPVVAGDGAGGWRMCAWSGGRLVPVGLPSGPGPSGPRPSGGRAPAAVPAIAVGFVPTKGDRPEWTVQKLTELGVDRIVVLTSGRSVVRWDGDRASRHLDKLREVARQAALQSRRLWLPTVEGVMAVDDVLCQRDRGAPVRWALAVPGGAPPTLGAGGPAAATGGPAAVAGVLIGPEGGWTAEEEAAGLPTVGLGDGILRAETAALAAGALLAGLRARMVAPAP